MHHGLMLLLTTVSATISACDAAGTGVIPDVAVMEQDAMSPIPADMTGPPGSRVRSPVLDQALSANSSAALIMFLLKYPDDPFADQARNYLRVRPTPDSAAKLQSAAGADSAAVAAFDAARLAGTDAAWDGFLARYGDHPLAAEVPRFR